MGTNYFLKSKPCVTCGVRKDKKHIGKSSGGWSFSFRGWDTYDFDYDDLDAKTIKSYADWKREFQDQHKEIVDEDGDVCTLADFLEMVEHKRGKLNHARIFSRIPPFSTDEERYMDTHREDRFDYSSMTKTCWVDDEGNSFCRSEFS